MRAVTLPLYHVGVTSCRPPPVADAPEAREIDDCRCLAVSGSPNRMTDILYLRIGPPREAGPSDGPLSL